MKEYIETVFQNFEFFRDHPTLKLVVPWLEVSRLHTVTNMLKIELLAINKNRNMYLLLDVYKRQ